MDVIFSIFLLLSVAICSFLGLFSGLFKDNLFQCIGLVMLGIWSASAIDRVLDRGFVRVESMILYSGLAMYSIGTAFKVIQHGKSEQACDAS